MKLWKRLLWIISRDSLNGVLSWYNTSIAAEIKGEEWDEKSVILIPEDDLESPLYTTSLENIFQIFSQRQSF